jgi:glycosyltransferase involved in cell wall biosynthesis
MDDNLDFSVVIPAKNEELHIADCLRSIFLINFDEKRYEVLVIDNGSTDRTVEVAQSMGATVFEKPGLTISGLRNFGASKANGKVLAFLDADCTVENDWLSNASKYLELSHIAAFGSAPILPPKTTWVQAAWFHIRVKKNEVEDVDWLESMNMFIPKQVFIAVGGFDETLITCEDHELSQRVSQKGRIVSDQRIRAVHHGEADTLGRFFRKERWRATSNYQGLTRRWKNIAEWPSIVLPLVHLLLCVLFIVTLLFVATGSVGSLALAATLLPWQVALFCLAIWKLEFKGSVATTVQLYILLNVYFLARGCALFGGGR